MHALDGEQDMNRMGGLRHQMPITWLTMLIAGLAISGIPPFAGFFSKDLILAYTYSSGQVWLWAARYSHGRPYRVVHVPAAFHDVLRPLAG